jgi:hypothetical protein
MELKYKSASGRSKALLLAQPYNTRYSPNRQHDKRHRWGAGMDFLSKANLQADGGGLLPI